MGEHGHNSGVGSMSEANSDMNMSFLETSDSEKIMSMDTEMENNTTCNGTNYELSANIPDSNNPECNDCFDFNGVPVVFSPINVNYNGK